MMRDVRSEGVECGAGERHLSNHINACRVFKQTLKKIRSRCIARLPSVKHA